MKLHLGTIPKHLFRSVYMDEGQRSKGMANPNKRAGFHLAFTWEKSALLPALALLQEGSPSSI